MRILLVYCLIAIGACRMPDQKKFETELENADTVMLHTSKGNAENPPDTTPAPLIPPPAKIQDPEGIFQVMIPYRNKVEQTIAFLPDHTYQLQERYLQNNRDSLVVIHGTWAPSDGYIWLYKDQVVRGRYSWKDKALQYYSPALKKSFTMNRMQDAQGNRVWREKAKTGIRFFGVGNEPFWNIEHTGQDTLSFRLAEWEQPVRLKISSAAVTADSSVFIAEQDSLSLRLAVYPQFCSDGMSDFTYRNRIRVQYGQQVFHGCGIKYR